MVGSPAKDRWQGVPPERIRELRDTTKADNVIVEADGSRGRLMKAPAAHEPSMPPVANVVMPVASLAVVGKTLTTAYVHRAELVAELLKLQPGSLLRLNHVAEVLLADTGGLKNTPDQSRIWPVLTRTDTIDQADLTKIIKRLTKHPRVIGVVTADRDWMFEALAAGDAEDAEATTACLDDA